MRKYKIKTAVILLVFISNLQITNAQFSFKAFDSKEVKQFLNTTTLAVFFGNAAFDSALVKAMKQYWKITPYRIIQPQKLAEYINNESYSFLIAHHIETVKSNEAGMFLEVRHYLCLFNGGKRKLKNYDFTDLVAFSAFDFYGTEQDRSYATYRLGHMVSGIHQTLNLIILKKIKGSKVKITENICKYYNQNSVEIKNRKILINDGYFSNKLDEEDIRKIFPFDFEIAQKQKITEAINKHDPYYFYLVKAATFDRSIVIYDPVNSEIIYAYYSQTGSNTLSKSDFKRITKTFLNIKK